MRLKPVIAMAWTAILLASAAALAAPDGPAIVLTPPAATGADAAVAVADALRTGDAQGAARLATLALDRHDLGALDRAHVELNRGLAREQLGQRERALSDFTNALGAAVLPRDERARALFDRGITFDELGRAEKAIVDYGAALALVPDFPAALNNRANAYRRLGRFAQARHDYEASLAAGNTQPQYSNYGLGQIAEAQGNPIAAQDYYRKALTADSGYKLAQQRIAALGKSLPQAAFVLRPPPEAAPITLKPPRRVADAPRPPARRPRITPVSYGAADSIPALRPAILGRFASVKRAQVQLGAYRAEGDAADGWNSLVGQADGLLGGLTPQIVAVDLPGRGRFYRLRAGPIDHDQASAFCARLKVRGLACLPVTR